MTVGPPALPPGFVWGVATSAYQIEGAVREDDRGASIWDTFCARPGAVRANANGEIACDFYHRHSEDVRLMRELGVDAFRFSIAWPRVLPHRRGRVNDRGLGFYDRLVDELLEAGIRPFPTLYHWDLPQALEDAGGWPSRDTASAFAEYVDAVAARLGDRVTDWATCNEPYCSSWLGYGRGVHAPGRRSVADALAAAHHVLLAHGLAVEALRGRCPHARVGIVLDSWPMHPAGPGRADRRAAELQDGIRNRWFFDPVLRGAYPEDAAAHLAPAAPPVRDGDMETIATPLDFVGLNYYSRSLVRAGPGGEPVEVCAREAPLTDMGWEVYPDALYEALTRLHREYAAPALYVMENGAAFADVRTHDGRVHDEERLDYLVRHVAAVGRAAREGVPVRGYFVWSLLDNFEWAFGYAKRFGLVYVDYPTLERVPKDSFFGYRDLIAASRLRGRGAA